MAHRKCSPDGIRLPLLTSSPDVRQDLKPGRQESRDELRMLYPVELRTVSSAAGLEPATVRSM